MLFPLFTSRVKYYKNGQWWFTKLMTRMIGENRYDVLRIERRIALAKMYYARQQILHQIFIDFPEIAHTIGIYPKADASHGFPHLTTYETFRDFQDNTINSDGWFAMFVVFVSLTFSSWTLYVYIFPSYWINNRPIKNGEEIRRRMVDYMSSAVAEETFGNKHLEGMLTPHMFHAMRSRFSQGYKAPDDVRNVFMTSFNRKHAMKEHYMQRVGDSSTMTAAL
jgi:hypothetical protein